MLSMPKLLRSMAATRLTTAVEAVRERYCEERQGFRLMDIRLTHTTHAAMPGARESLCEQAGARSDVRSEVTCLDCQDLLAREDEDAASRERYYCQNRRADLSPLEATGHWQIEVSVRHHPHTLPKYLYQRESESAARNLGMKEACAGPTIAVRVTGPDGVVVYSYDREGGYWIDHRSQSATATPVH